MDKKVVIGKSSNVTPQLFNNDFAKNVEKRILIGSNIGAPNFVMRLFTVKKGGYSPKHSHHWEHEVFIVKGKAEVFNGKDYIPAEEGSFVFVPPHVEHQFKNAGDDDLKFICVIPSSADEE
jgi:quercetin dioxygenase-like cupin family protein